MFRLFSGSWQFERIAEVKTLVTFKYHFMCQPDWLHWLMHPIGRWFLGREIHRRLLAFRKAGETPGMVDRLHAELCQVEPRA